MLPLKYNVPVKEYDDALNSLEFTKSKLKFPQVFNSDEANDEIVQMSEKLEGLKNELQETTNIETTKDSMYRQLNEYTEYLSKAYMYKFSKSQSMYKHAFYVTPLLNIRDVLFFGMQGGVGVYFMLTLDEKDAVNDKDAFIDVLTATKKEIHNSGNLLELYNAYRNLSETLKKDFY